jgi:hypothetical protein
MLPGLPASVNSTMSPADSGVVSPFEHSERGEFFASYLQQSYKSQKACSHLYSHAHVVISIYDFIS